MDWKITKVKYQDVGDKNNVCIVSYFTCSKSIEDNGETFSASHSNSISLNIDNLDDDFIAYEDVTEEQLIAWTKEQLTEVMVDAIERNLDGTIAKKKIQTVKQGVPWV